VSESDEQMEKARRGMRRHLAYYASTPSYRPVLEAHGWGDLQTELHALSKRAGWAAMAELVDDEVLDTFTIMTTPASLVDEVRARYGGLVDRITVSWWGREWWPPVGAALAAL